MLFEKNVSESNNWQKLNVIVQYTVTLNQTVSSPQLFIIHELLYHTRIYEM